MRKFYVVGPVMAAVMAFSGIANAGWISALKDKVTGSESPDEQQVAAQAAPETQATPAPAENPKAAATKTSGKSTKGGKTVQGKSKMQIVEGTPPPAGATPQATPDKETIRKGAQKLAAEMNVEKIPSDLFRRYAGKWKGDFWVYSPNGQKEQSQAASIEYTVNGDGTMKMESFYYDRISKNWVTAETATYVNEGDKLRVTIKRPNGQIAKQTGHFNDGQLFLLADISDGVEHYRERVDGKRLLIDGFGVYASKQSDSHVFIGRFLKEQ
jgi:hypothetical protein